VTVLIRYSAGCASKLRLEHFAKIENLKQNAELPLYVSKQDTNPLSTAIFPLKFY